jgi:HK97 family phage major capsid protein
MENDVKNIKDEIVNAVKTEVLDAIKAEKRSLEQASLSASAPKTEGVATEVRELAEAIREKRSISLAGTGISNVVAQMTKLAAAKMPLLGKVKYFYGRDASTNIPVWAPSLAVPSNYDEGATGVSSDSTAVLGVTSITPYSYISVLPITNEALLLTGSNLEAELPGIFAEAFAKAMHAGICTGSGTGRNMQGLFTASVIPAANLVACAAAGAPKMADLVSLALKVADYYDDGAIVMNSAIYSAVMADTTDGIQMYKQELAANKTIEGVKVILTSYAPSATTADALVAVGGNFADYAIGMANALEIQPMKKVGDNVTYFQAVAYFNGKPILADNFFALKAISA